MPIELNDDQTCTLVQLLLNELEATKAFLSMEEGHAKILYDEVAILKAEIKTLKAAKTAKPAKKAKVAKVVEPVKRGRGRPKKTVE